MVTLLLTLLGLSALYFIVMWSMDIIKNKGVEGEDSNPIVGFFIGLVTDFMDTLGIGSFAPTT